MLGHSRFERGKPGRVGAFRLGKQFVTRPHRRFVARRVVGMARLEGEHQPVEESSPRACAVGEQTVHCRGQPQYRQPFGQRVDRGRCAVDADLATVRCSGEGAGAELDTLSRGRGLPSRHPEPARPVAPRHFAQWRPAQTASRCQQRHRLQDIGLARAIVARQQDESRPRLNQRGRIIAKIGEGEAGKRGHSDRSITVGRSHPHRHQHVERRRLVVLAEQGRRGGVGEVDLDLSPSIWPRMSSR